MVLCRNPSSEPVGSVVSDFDQPTCGVSESQCDRTRVFVPQVLDSAASRLPRGLAASPVQCADVAFASSPASLPTPSSGSTTPGRHLDKSQTTISKSAPHRRKERWAVDYSIRYSAIDSPPHSGHSAPGDPTDTPHVRHSHTRSSPLCPNSLPNGETPICVRCSRTL